MEKGAVTVGKLRHNNKQPYLSEVRKPLRGLLTHLDVLPVVRVISKMHQRTQRQNNELFSISYDVKKEV